MWHLTCDKWHVTHDTWHMTRDMRHGTCEMLWGVNIISKFQLPSSSGLRFMLFWRLGGKGSISDWINQWRGCTGSVKYQQSQTSMLWTLICVSVFLTRRYRAVNKLCQQNTGGSRPALPPLSAIVSISPTPPPPFVSRCQHFPNPPSPLCQLCQYFPNPPSLFHVSFVNISNATLFLNNLFFGSKGVIWQKILINPEDLDKNLYF